VPTLREDEEAVNTSHADVDKKLLSQSAGGDSLPDIPLPNVPFLEAHPDDSVGEERTSPGIAEAAMVAGFRLGSGSCHVRFLCSNLFLWGIDHYTLRQVFGALRVYFIYG